MFSNTTKFLALAGLCACQVLLAFHVESYNFAYLIALSLLSFFTLFEDVVIRGDRQCSDGWKFQLGDLSMILLFVMLAIFAGQWIFTFKTESLVLFFGTLLAIAFFYVHSKEVQNENDIQG